jgi:hypothetical protein
MEGQRRGSGCYTELCFLILPPTADRRRLKPFRDDLENAVLRAEPKAKRER